MSTPRGFRLPRRASRYVLAAVVAVAGYHSSRQSLAGSVARTRIEAAHQIAPRDPQISARLAFSLSGPGASKQQRARAEALALDALRQDATAVAAVVTLGINAELRGDAPRSRRLFEYAQVLSRRNLPTQFWAIENAVARNDIAGALSHYDIALRTSPESSELLFPIMIAASSDASIRAPLLRMLAVKPPWGEAFLSEVAEKGKDPLAIASFLFDARRAGATVPVSARIAIINALANAGYANQAWQYYAAERSGVDRVRSRDPSFTATVENPSLLDWTTVESPGISSSIEPAPHGGMFEYSAPASSGGSVLQQLQMLTPGSYRLSGHSSGIDQPDGQRPFWLLTCHDGREFGRVELPSSSVDDGKFSGRLVVPGGCGIQMLQLVTRAATSAAGTSGQILRVQLEPDR